MMPMFYKSEPKLTQKMIFQEILSENSTIQGNFCVNSGDGGFPGIPDREFSVALNYRYNSMCKIMSLQFILRSVSIINS